MTLDGVNDRITTTGTQIDFGSENIVTTGTITADSFIGTVNLGDTITIGSLTLDGVNDTITTTGTQINLDIDELRMTSNNNPTITLVGGTDSIPSLKFHRGELETDLYTDWEIRSEDNHLFFTTSYNNVTSDKIKFDISGRVGIGFTSILKASLEVDGRGASRFISSYGYLKSDGTVGVSSGNSRYTIWSAGIIGATEFQAVSDDRLKVQEEYIVDATSSLMKLRPQKYYKKSKLDSEFQAEFDEWNTKKTELQVKIDEIETIPEEDRTHEQSLKLAMYYKQMEIVKEEEPTNDAWLEAGLIAQEVFYDAPELRHIVTTGLEPGEVSETPPEGYNNPDPSIDPDYSNWGSTAANLKYNNFIAYLIKGFQEQQTIITDLRNRIELLEN